MKEISPLGWALIAAISFIVLYSYWSLISLLRNRNKQQRPPSWTKTWHILSHPFEAENRDLDRLSKEVSSLGKQTMGDEDQTSKT